MSEKAISASSYGSESLLILGWGPVVQSQMMALSDRISSSPPFSRQI